MKTRSFISLGIFSVVVLAAVLLFMSSFGRSGKQGEILLQTAPVLPRSFDVTVNTVGELDAADSQMVSSAVRGDKGKIIYIVEDGTQVTKGDVLIRLDPTPFEGEVHRLSGEVRRFEAAVDAARQMLEWEKNQTEREILSAEFDLKLARLELKKLTEGDGPIQLARLKEEMEKAEEEHRRYSDYIEELTALVRQNSIQTSEVSLARAKLAELKKKLKNTSLKFRNYKKHVFPSQVETAKAKVQKAEALIDQIKKGAVYKVAKAISGVRVAEEHLKTMKSDLTRAQMEFAKTILDAPISGIAILYETFRDGKKRKPRVGDRVWQNQPLLYLPDISSMIVKTQVREVDLHKIALKQPCMVTVDAYPLEHFEGDVDTVGVLATGQIEGSAGEKYFQLVVSLRNGDSRLRPGMTARVTIFSSHCENAPTIPFTALFEEFGRTYCYKKSGDRFEKVGVSCGRRNEKWVEVLDGLHVGEQVALTSPPPEKIAVR